MNDNAELTGALSSLNIGDELNDNDMSAVVICAACGKEGDGDSMNTCNKCDLVQYCNAACKKKHRKTHKKKCEKRAAELYDEKLFKEHQTREECPICMLPLPLAADQTTFYSCCGKNICDGCIVAMVESGAKNICAFCRTPDAKSDEEIIRRNKKLMDRGNAYAFYMLAGCYAQGRISMPQDRAKANELYLKAGELGCATAYFNLGNAYDNGRGVEIDKKKAKHYHELGAMNGSVKARHNLGVLEVQADNTQRAYKHFILAARAGHDKALEGVKIGFKHGFVTKDEYGNTLRAYQKSKDEMKSDTRDKLRVISER